MTEIADWPAYPIGPRDSIFAIGVVSTKFAELESAMQFLFSTVFGLNREDGILIFAKIGNETAIDLTKRRLAKTEWPQKILDDVLYFVKAFEICKDNRNALMHSDLVWGPHKTVLFKTTKKALLRLQNPLSKRCVLSQTISSAT